VWHIGWLAIVSLLAIVALVLARSADTETETVIHAAEVERIERALREGAQA
jgi:hypothetical protein